MFWLKKILLAAGTLLAALMVLTAVNILQNGLGGGDGRTVEAILGVPAEQAARVHVEALSKADVMALFRAAPAPSLVEMEGEYLAKLLPVGVLAPLVDLFTQHLFGPGRWKGKAFRPVDPATGEGYNLFADKRDGKRIEIFRVRRMQTYIGPSRIDARAALHLDYRPFNSGLVHTLHDEIRKINDALYLGMGYTAAGGGALNPAPFIVFGKIGPWVGSDAR